MDLENEFLVLGQIGKIQRLESLIGRAIPTLRIMAGSPRASKGQRALAKETLKAIFAEQDEYKVLP